MHTDTRARTHEQPQTYHGLLLEQGIYRKYVVKCLFSVKYVCSIKAIARSNMNRVEAWEAVRT